MRLVPLARLILVKFVGGVLAIGSGLALGPEGPSVQMGAAGARILGDRMRRPWRDVRALIAAGAGAGLAAAFNAPIAGAVFVLEELERRFEHRTAVAAIGASSAAIIVSRLMLGDGPGAARGRLAARVVWSRSALLRRGGHLADRHRARRVRGGGGGALQPPDPRHRRRVGAARSRRGVGHAAWMGAVVGVVAWVSPALVGSGSDMTVRLLAGSLTAAAIPAYFAVRYALGAASHSAFTPGGLFAPLLLLGAQMGLLCGVVARAALPGLGIDPAAFAVVGMAAFFVGVVRAPVTGIVLVIEMTAAFTSLLPMLAASFAAMTVAQWMGSAPIYDSLRSRVLGGPSSRRPLSARSDPRFDAPGS